jgi:hypothetical protein
MRAIQHLIFDTRVKSYGLGVLNLLLVSMFSLGVEVLPDTRAKRPVTWFQANCPGRVGLLNQIVAPSPPCREGLPISTYPLK